MDLLSVIESDAVRIGEAIATATTGGSGTATLEPVQAVVGNKTLDATVTIAVSKGTAAPKGSALNDGLRLAEAFVQAAVSGSGSCTLEPFGFSIAGESLVFATSVSVSAR